MQQQATTVLLLFLPSRTHQNALFAILPFSFTYKAFKAEYGHSGNCKHAFPPVQQVHASRAAL